MKQKFPIVIKKGNSRVTIYRCQKGKYTEFRLAHHVQGKRVFESYASFEHARTRADEINESFNSGDIQALTLNAGERQEYTVAREALQPFGISVATAALQFAEAQRIIPATSIIRAVQYYAQHRPDLYDKKTVQEIVDEFLEMKKVRGVSNDYHKRIYWTLKGRRIQGGRWKANPNRSFAACFKCPLSSITADDLKRFMHTGTHCAGTYNYRLATVRELFRFAKSRKYVPGDYCEHEALPTKKNAGDCEPETYTPSEMLKILSAATGPMRTILAICAFAGLRVSEAVRLEWQDIGVEGGRSIRLIRKKSPKSRRSRLVPISDNLRAWLPQTPPATGKIWILSLTRFQFLRQQLMKDIGIPMKRNALRKSCISYRMAETRNAQTVSDEAGNSPSMVYQFYRAVVSPEKAKEWFSVAPTDASDKITYLKAS